MSECAGQRDRADVGLASQADVRSESLTGDADVRVRSLISGEPDSAVAPGSPAPAAESQAAEHAPNSPLRGNSGLRKALLFVVGLWAVCAQRPLGSASRKREPKRADRTDSD